MRGTVRSIASEYENASGMDDPRRAKERISEVREKAEKQYGFGKTEEVLDYLDTGTRGERCSLLEKINDRVTQELGTDDRHFNQYAKQVKKKDGFNLSGFRGSRPDAYGFVKPEMQVMRLEEKVDRYWGPFKASTLLARKKVETEKLVALTCLHNELGDPLFKIDLTRENGMGEIDFDNAYSTVVSKESLDKIMASNRLGTGLSAQEKLIKKILEGKIDPDKINEDRHYRAERKRLEKLDSKILKNRKQFKEEDMSGFQMEARKRIEYLQQMGVRAAELRSLMEQMDRNMSVLESRIQEEEARLANDIQAMLDQARNNLRGDQSGDQDSTTTPDANTDSLSTPDQQDTDQESVPAQDAVIPPGITLNVNVNTGTEGTAVPHEPVVTIGNEVPQDQEEVLEAEFEEIENKVPEALSEFLNDPEKPEDVESIGSIDRANEILEKIIDEVGVDGDDLLRDMVISTYPIPIKESILAGYDAGRREEVASLLKSSAESLSVSMDTMNELVEGLFFDDPEEMKEYVIEKYTNRLNQLQSDLEKVSEDDQESRDILTNEISYMIGLLENNFGIEGPNLEIYERFKQATLPTSSSSVN